MKNKKILIIDDSSMFRKVIQTELEPIGCRVDEAQTKEECIELLEKNQYDIIFVDLILKDINGFELYKELREKFEVPESSVVFLTANDSLENREEGLRLGVLDFIGKNFVPGEISHFVVNKLSKTDFVSSQKALIVDDSSMSRKVAKLFLKDTGIECFEASSGPEALEMIKKTEFNIVITDYVMPEMNGIEFCKAVRKLGFRELPIIVVSANPEREMVLQCFNGGANDYLAKPYFKEEFLSRVCVLLERNHLSKLRLNELSHLKELLELKEKLFAISSHDMKSPLAGAEGLTSLLIDELEDICDEDQMETLRLIHSSCVSTLRLVDEIGTLTKLNITGDFIQVEEVNPLECLNESLVEQSARAQFKKINIKIQNEESVLINSNKSVILHLFNNLIGNAIKFTPEEKEVSIKMNCDDDIVEFSILDGGVGFTERQLSEFNQLITPGTSSLGTRGEKGTGLGLQLNFELLKIVEGKILFKNRENGGGEVILTFPRHKKS